jgi:hypothetical protein
MINYFPKKFILPKHLISAPSAWIGIESILEDLLDTFKVGGNNALEFGVEYGYSTVALSNYFQKVIGGRYFYWR